MLTYNRDDIFQPKEFYGMMRVIGTNYTIVSLYTDNESTIFPFLNDCEQFRSGEELPLHIVFPPITRNDNFYVGKAGLLQRRLPSDVKYVEIERSESIPSYF